MKIIFVSILILSFHGSVAQHEALLEEFYKETGVQRKRASKFNKIEYIDPQQANLSLHEFLLPFRGKTILLDLWATWCVPCKLEFTKYDSSFYQFMNDRQIEIVFVSFDDDKRKKAWKKDIQKFNINGYHAMSGPTLRGSINDEIYHRETNYIPRYILVNADGEILSRTLPKPSSPDFRMTINTLLKK